MYRATHADKTTAPLPPIYIKAGSYLVEWKCSHREPETGAEARGFPFGPSTGPVLRDRA